MTRLRSTVSARGTLLAAALACTAGAGASRLRITPALDGGKALAQFELEEPSAWTIADGALVLRSAGTPAGPIRRPSRLAVLKSAAFGDVTLRARVRCDAPVKLKGRDVLLLFGYQSPTRFYYVHLSNETTYPHNGIFVVADADRKRLHEVAGEPRLHDREWHAVRLVRDVARGSIEVYLDGDAKPALAATDRTLLAGRVGFGSFDDTGAFTDIVVEGEAAAAP